MPTVGAYATQSDNFLSPRILPGAAATGGPSGISSDDREALTQRIFNARYQEERGSNVFTRIGGYAAASVIDMADTIVGNQLIPGTDRGDVWNLVGDYGGPIGHELQRFYEKNQSGVETLSGVAGAIGTAYVGGALLLPRISAAMARSTAISSSRLWQAGARANAATRQRMLDSQAQAAYNGQAFNMWKSSAGRRFAANRAGALAGTALFEEALIGVTMNANKAIWSDEVSENLFFAGLGLTIGGGLGALGARFEMRRVANSVDQIRRRADAIDPQGITALREYQPDTDWLEAAKHAEGLESAKATALLLEARQATPETATPEMSSLLDAQRVQAESQAIDSLQKITTKGIPGVSGTQFSLDAGNNLIGAHIKALGHNDPTAFFGLESIGLVGNKSVDTILNDFVENVKTLKNSKKATQIREANHLEEQQALLIVDGKLLPATTPEAKALSHYKPGQLDFKATAADAAEFKFKTETGGTYKINESFAITKQGVKGAGPVTPARLPVNERLQLVEATQKVFDTLKKQKGHQYNVPKDASWYQLDSALEFERQGGVVNWGSSHVKSQEGAILQSLRLKAKEIKANPIGSFWDRLGYNLPLPSSVERIYDDAGDSFRALLEAAEDPDITLETLTALRQRMHELHGFELRAEAESLNGSLFRFNKTDSNQWRQMAVGFYQNERWMKPLTEWGIAEQMAELKAARFHTLRAETDKGGIVPTLVDLLHQTPDFANSMQIRGLADDQVTGLGSAVKQGAGEILTREMRYRDNKVMLSLLRTREIVNRMTDQQLQQLVKTHLGNVTPRLNAATATGSKALVNQFFSNTSGWDLMRQPVDMGDGHFGFQLKKTAANERRLGRAVEDDEMLVNPRTEKPIVLDNLAMEFVDGFQSIANQILADKNRLRKAMGLRELNSRPWYAPPPNTKNMFVGFVLDADGNAIPGGAVIAKTSEEFKRLKAEAMHGMVAGERFVTREAAEEAADVWDRAAMDWIDPGVGAAPARGSRGALAADTVNPNAVADTLDWIKSQMEGIGTNTMRVLYDSQLGIAKSRAAMERSTQGLRAKGAIGQKIEERVRTIWDEYQATVLGQSLGDQKRSISGSLMHPVESIFNGGLAAVWPAMKWMAPSHAAQWVGDVFNRAGIRAPRAARTFSELSDQLGPHTPYADATDFIEQTRKVIRPPEIRGISQELNRLSAAVLLRYFELPHAAMNLIGIITTMPSIARTGRAPISAFFDSPHGPVGIVDSMSMMTRALGDMTHGRRGPDWDFMVRNGDTTQQVAEFNQQMALVTDRGTFGRVFLGTGSKGGRTGIRGLAKEKGIDGLISVATDTTENWSRTYSHFVGLRIADAQGIVGMEARHAYAREIANAAIANYNPMNRPELYNSALGSMFGLFMSWMQSYNQRLFRWMETGDYASVGRQAVMQSSLFGLTSLPGYKIVENLMLKAGVGETTDGQEATLTDHMYAKFGPLVGSALANGGISETGVVLYTRGDMNYRDVTLDPTRLMAGLGVSGSAVAAVTDALQSLFSSSSLDDSGRLAEIAARHMPNRVLKGIMVSTMNGGIDTDSRGQIVSENKDTFETMLRITGLRSHRQQAEIEAFYASRQLQDREAARMDVLRNETRSLIRSDPAGWQNRAQELFDKYSAAGGSPAHFRTWIRDQFRQATSTRGMNAMQKAFANPKNHQDVWRYNAYGAN